MRGVPAVIAGRWPAARRKGAAPYQGRQSITDALGALPEEEPLPGPRFTPGARRPDRETGEIPELALPGNARPEPALARPYVRGGQGGPLDKSVPVAIAADPVIGDSLPGAVAGPPQAALFEAAPPRPMAVLYTEPGWAGLQMSRWTANGEWDDVHALFDQGLGRNAAENATSFRHSRETIGGQVRQRLAAIGRPDLADILLRHVHELNLAARATAEAGAA